MRGVAVDAHPRRIGYLQSNLFDSSEPHQKSYRRSLSPRFRSAYHAFQYTVSPAFAFSLISRFPTHLSRALATFVSLSKATVQSNYPPVAVPITGLAARQIKSGVTLTLHRGRSPCFDAPAYAMYNPSCNNCRL